MQQQQQVNDNNKEQTIPDRILDWRDRRQRSLSDDKSAAAATVPLSNCHSMAYTAEIRLGSPAASAQSFAVGLDTGVDDFYVPSARCDDTCAPQWRRYDAAASGTSSNTTTVNEKYDVLYLDGESIEGQFVQDTLRLGQNTADASSVIAIENAIFAAITSFHEYTECPGQEGVLGLGRSVRTDFGVPSPVQQLLDSKSQQLRNNVFALYLNNTAGSDDYPPDPGDDPAAGEHGDDVDVSKYRAASASSQLTIGALSHAHYQGCLQWHDALDLEQDFGAEASVFWALSLQGVKVDDEVLPSGDLALVDSGSMFVLGPGAAIGKFLVMNLIECFDLDEASGDAYLVDCSDGVFDVAATSCDNDNLRPLTFVVDGKTYQLTADELILKVETDDGDEVCFLRVMTDDYIFGWVLGDALLNRYYAVFDFERHRIGLAPSIDRDDGSYCKEDWPLDLDYVEGAPVPEPAPTVATLPPTPSPSSSGDVDKDNKTSVPFPKMGPPAPPSVGASSASSSSGSGGAKQQSLLIAVSFVLGAVLMVFVITLRRSFSRRHYRRADRPYSNDDGGELELPGLL